MTNDVDVPVRSIAVFAKSPVPGTVKSRLAPAFSAADRVRLHCALCERAVRTASSIANAAVTLFAAPDPAHPFFNCLAKRHHCTLAPQVGEDLGTRMHRALSVLLRSSTVAVLIGSDSPALRGQFIAQAFEALEKGRDVVLTPAADGGYVLIGARARAPRSIFEDVNWGCATVLRETEEKLRAASLSYELVGRCHDIDRPIDIDLVNADIELRDWPTRRYVLC